MKEAATTTTTIREVHRETSQVFDRVESGERVTVTRNGEEIAEIIPIDPVRRLLARWEKEGLAPPTPDSGWAHSGSIHPGAVGLPAGASGRTLGSLLEEMREHER